MKFITPVEVSPGATGWQDVNVSAYVPSSTVGVLLHFVNNSGTGTLTWGVRKKGSTDTRTGNSAATGHMWIFVGVNEDLLFEANLSNTTSLDILLEGYVTKEEGTFFTNAITKNPSSTGSFQDVDISVETGSEKAVVAFFHVTGPTSAYKYGLRQKGSTDDWKADGRSSGFWGVFMAVDASEVLQIYRDSASTNFYLVGYLTKNFVPFTNAKNYQTATVSSYVDVNFSTDIPVNAVGAACVMLADESSTNYLFDLRKKGYGTDRYYYPLWAIDYVVTEIDSNRYAEQKISNALLDLYLFGYFTESKQKTFTIDGIIQGNARSFTIDGIVADLSPTSGYILNSTSLPRPKEFTRQFIPVSQDITAITGHEGRDFRYRTKEKFTLSWEILSKSEVETIMTIVNLNTAVSFYVLETNLSVAQTSVLLKIKDIEYVIVGSGYKGMMTLELEEVS